MLVGIPFFVILSL